jgi:hypothetical protein
LGTRDVGRFVEFRVSDQIDPRLDEFFGFDVVVLTFFLLRRSPFLPLLFFFLMLVGLRRDN